MVRKTTRMFFEAYSVLYLGWDPNKEPTLELGPDGTYRQVPLHDIRTLLTHCAEKSRAPLALYRSLETLCQRTTLFKVGLLGPGPGAQLLARTILDTKAELEVLVDDLIEKLSTLALSLEKVVNTISGNGSGRIVRTSREHLDSVERKTDRLQYMKVIWDK